MFYPHDDMSLGERRAEGVEARGVKIQRPKYIVYKPLEDQPLALRILNFNRGLGRMSVSCAALTDFR